MLKGGDMKEIYGMKGQGCSVESPSLELRYNGNYGAYQKTRSKTSVTVFWVFTFVV